MIDKTNNRILFGRDGCVTEEGLGLFVDNKLSKAELVDVEEHAKHCELCNDALEGSLLFNNADNFHQKLNDVKDSKGKLLFYKPAKTRKLIVTISSVAASLVVLLGVYSIVKLERLSDDVFPISPTDGLAIITKDTAQVEPPKLFERKRADSEKIIYKAEKETIVEENAVPKPVKPLIIEEDLVIENVEEEIIVEELEFNGIEYDVELEYIAVEAQEEPGVAEDIPLASAAAEPQVETEKLDKAKRSLARKSRSSSFGKKDESYMMAEITPMFQGGGAEAFDRYLADNLSVVIPDSVFVESIVVSFVIDTAGNIDKVKLVSGTSSKELNKYIINFIESSPVWVPGYVAGRPIETEQESEIVLDSTNRKNLQ